MGMFIIYLMGYLCCSMIMTRRMLSDNPDVKLTILDVVIISLFWPFAIIVTLFVMWVNKENNKCNRASLKS